MLPMLLLVLMMRLQIAASVSILPHPEFSLFDPGHVVGRVDNSELNEISGMVFSRRHGNVIYVHNDSGGYARLYAISAITGHYLATFEVDGATNCDWEDLTIGGGPGGGNYIYIGDIGGNYMPCNRVYRVKEPEVIEDGILIVEGALEFSWEENNSETLLSDPDGGVYLISKVLPASIPSLYRLPEEWLGEERVNITQSSPVNIVLLTEGPTAGDISPNGRELLLKTYNAVYHWVIDDGLTEGLGFDLRLARALEQPPGILAYRPESQGEALCWDINGEGYYTTSEEANPQLIYHKRVYTNAIP